MIPAKVNADRWWRKVVRHRGYCQASEHLDAHFMPDGYPVVCGGLLEAAHVFGRGVSMTRVEVDNGLCLCSAHHRWFDEGHTHALHTLCRTVIGDGRYDRLLVLSRRVEHPDWAGKAAELRETAQRIGAAR